MLSTKKITIEAKTIIDDKEIMGYRATIEPGKNDDVMFYAYQIDKPACKEHRELVRREQAEFEDYAYNLQEKLKESEE